MSEIAKNCININQQVKHETLPLIGREAELNSIIQTLCRRNKNNPLLLGEAGVGKTALVYGLARRINEGSVPLALRSMTIYSLTINSLIAGTSIRGSLESKIQAILDEACKPSNRIILFIDEIHTIYRNSLNESGLGDIFKPYLTNSSLKCIGATTNQEFNIIEKDRALKRRFTTIYVAEPSINESIAILRGIKSSLENHYGLTITDRAISTAVNLAKKHLYDLKLPDSALDLLEETMSRLVFNLQIMPEEISNINIEIESLELERESLRIEKHATATGEIQRLDNLINEKKNTVRIKKEIWEKEKQNFNIIKNLKTERSKLLNEAAADRKANDFVSAGKILYIEIPSIERRIAELEDKTERIYISDIVSARDIIKTVSRKTGIPIERFEIDSTTIEKLKEYLGRHILCQEGVISALCSHLTTVFAGFSNENTPLASFLFLGSTGVGKTELAQRISEFLFGKDAILRLDMSEFSEKYTVSALLGSAPGYVGFEGEGQLTGPIRRRPHQLVLLDEIEKAHPSVHQIFLQILDNGIVTDRAGRTVSFRNCIIVMTSNTSSYLTQENSLNDEHKEMDPEKMIVALQKIFSSEFLNRFNSILMFNSLTSVNAVRITRLHLERIISRYNREHGYEISYNDDVVDYVVSRGFHESMGAREMVRTIYKTVIITIAERLAQTNSRTLRLVVRNDNLECEVVDCQLGNDSSPS